MQQIKIMHLQLNIIVTVHLAFTAYSEKVTSIGTFNMFIFAVHLKAIPFEG